MGASLRFSSARARRQRGAFSLSDEDVERLRLVARALKAGYRVPARSITRGHAELEQTLGASRLFEAEPVGQVPSVPSLVEAMARDDVSEVRNGLRCAALSFGPRRFVVDLAGPLCTAVGESWERNEIAIRQEHVFAGQLTSQLRLMLAAYEHTERPPVVALATLPGEVHALGIEMTAVYLAAVGAAPRLLGTELPPEQIGDAARASRRTWSASRSASPATGAWPRATCGASCACSRSAAARGLAARARPRST